jgi:hypothetical protein
MQTGTARLGTTHVYHDPQVGYNTIFGKKYISVGDLTGYKCYKPVLKVAATPDFGKNGDTTKVKLLAFVA